MHIMCSFPFLPMNFACVLRSLATSKAMEGEGRTFPVYKIIFICFVPSAQVIQKLRLLSHQRLPGKFSCCCCCPLFVLLWEFDMYTPSYWLHCCNGPTTHVVLGNGQQWNRQKRIFWNLWSHFFSIELWVIYGILNIWKQNGARVMYENYIYSCFPVLCV